MLTDEVCIDRSIYKSILGMRMFYPHVSELKYNRRILLTKGDCIDGNLY